MIRKNMLVAVSLLLYPALLMGQGSGLTNEDLLKPLKDSWPTYNGDYTGRRYSALTQVNRTTVKQLTLGWMSHLTAGADLPQPTGGGQRRGARTRSPQSLGVRVLVISRSEAARSKAQCCRWTARCMSPCPTTPGP